MNAVANYVSELTAAIGTAWNRFWFTAVDPIGVSAIRALTGTVALWYLVSFTGDLVTWFGPNGLLPHEAVKQLTATSDGRWNARWSYLNYIDIPALLWTAHVVGVLIVAAMTAGFQTRITSVLSLGVVLSYVHRGPMITGQFEPVLTMMLFYLTITPCGSRLSVDAHLAQRRGRQVPVEPSVAANIGQRLMQVHVAALYLMMSLTKLGGESATWWNGEGMWWLIAYTESRLVDLTFLNQHMFVVNLWTQEVVLFEALFGLLIWRRLARPLLLALAVAHWLALGLVTGLLSYVAMMLVANLVFLSPDDWRFVTAATQRE